MASRLRTNSGTKISFFAFQDIITSVTGILILVTLILTLYMTETRPTTSAEAQLQEQLTEVLRRAAALARENRQQQASLEQLATVPSPERLQAEVRTLASQVAEQSNRVARLAVSQAELQTDAARREASFGLAELRERGGQVEQDLAAERQTNATLVTQIRNLEQQRQELERRIEREATNTHRLWLIPETTTAAKQPVLVVVDGRKITLERFNQAAQRREINASGAVAGEFATALRQWNPARDYVVFYLRPSGLDQFETLKETARRAGFDIGYDAVEEDKQIVFSAPTAP